MNTYFFIPSNNLKYIEKAKSLSADYTVYDLEDAIVESQTEIGIQNLSNISVKKNDVVRPRLKYNEKLTDSSIENIKNLVEIGFKTFIIPKFSTIEQLVEIKSIFSSLKNELSEFKFILVPESPLGLLNLRDALNSEILNIQAIGFGSHDYCNEINMAHNLNNLYFGRLTVLNTAKAYKIDAIDIVSINLSDDEDFINEVLNGFSLGFEGKFLIHPKQLELINKIQFYTDEEISEAEEVYPYIVEIEKNNESILKIKGKVYEKPHIKRVLRIIKWKSEYGS